MEEPVRLACPQCELVYRLKRYTPGKAYSCKNCGGPLTRAEALSAGGGNGGTQQPHAAAQSSFDNTSDLAGGRAGIAAGLAPESELNRLPRLIEELSQRLDGIRELELSQGETGPAVKLLELNEKLDEDLREFKSALENRLSELADKVTGDLQNEREEVNTLRDGLTEMDSRLVSAIDEKFRELRLEIGDRLGDLHQGVSGLSEKTAPSTMFKTGMDGLRQELREQHEAVAARLEALEGLRESQKQGFEALRELQKQDMEASRELQQKFLTTHLEAQKRELFSHQENQKHALNALLSQPVDGIVPGGTTVEVNIDELADRLVAGLRGTQTKFVDPESGLAMDAMARLADELVKEQSANTARLNSLADEIKNATSGISKIEEWRGELPGRVADEIGQTVEARVIGPISGALAKQAPSILSDLQDNKLVDIVSRSVREAQRPLLREILSSSRGGIPVWLFASILLPLLLILGYLFLPGEVGTNRHDGSMDEVAESLARIESGMGVSADNEDRLRTIEEAVLDVHAEALAHVRNAATLEAENHNLKALLTERDQLMNEYKETLQTQVKRLREYEMRLVQLGVSPKSMGE